MYYETWEENYYNSSKHLLFPTYINMYLILQFFFFLHKNSFLFTPKQNKWITYTFQIQFNMQKHLTSFHIIFQIINTKQFAFREIKRILQYEIPITEKMYIYNHTEKKYTKYIKKIISQSSLYYHHRWQPPPPPISLLGASVALHDFFPGKINKNFTM